MHPYGCHSLSPLYLPSVNNHLQESLPMDTKQIINIQFIRCKCLKENLMAAKEIQLKTQSYWYYKNTLDKQKNFKNNISGNNSIIAHIK